MAPAAKENGIVEGVIWKQILIIFFPILIGMFFQQLYSTADTVIVGRCIGKEALAAVGTTGRITDLFVGFFMGLSSGAAVAVAQFAGAGEREKVTKAVWVSLLLAAGVGMGLTLVGLLSARASLSVLGVPEAVAGDALTYLNVYYTGMTASLLYNMGTGILRAMGDARTPLYVLVACCGVNIVLDLLFITALGMGVFGAALATVLAQTASAAAVLLRLRGRVPCRTGRQSLRPAGGILKKVVHMGLPAGMQSILYSFSHLVIQSAVNSFGTDTIAAWTAVGKIDALLWMVTEAFGIAVTTFAGQNFGAGRYDRVKRGARVCLGMAFCATLAPSAGMLLFVEPLLRFFNSDPAVIATGAACLRIMGPFYSTFVFVEVFSGTIRGAGEALPPAAITCVGTCILRIGWVLWVLPLRPVIQTLAWVYPVTWIVPSVMFIIYYSRMGWLKRCIRQNQTAGQ